MPPGRVDCGRIPELDPIPPVSDPMPPRALEVRNDRLPDPIPPDMEDRLNDDRTGSIVEFGRGRNASAPPAMRYGMKPPKPPAYGIRELPPDRDIVSAKVAP
jgi:hypothetical protein